MRSITARPALPLVVIMFALAAPRTAGARVQGTPECPIAPTPEPNTSYSCNFARMPLYDQGDANLAWAQLSCTMYAENLVDRSTSCSSTQPCPWPWETCHNGTCVQPACGSPNASWPFAQSWLPWGPANDAPNGFYSMICSSTSEAMALNAALAYRSSNTAFTGEYCTSSTQCPESFTCANNACTPAGASCGGGIHCATGYTCQNAVCVAAACSGSTPCPSGFACTSGTCAPALSTAYTPVPPTSRPATDPGTNYTFAFNQAAHTAWGWNCTDYTSQSAAMSTPPYGFVGGCMGNGPLNLWPSGISGAPAQTVYGLQQVVHMSLQTNTTPDAGWSSTIGTQNWPYYASLEPFAAELYNNAADGAPCSIDANCNPGYCLDAPNAFHVQQPGGPQGYCGSAAYQALTTWSSTIPGYSSSISITSGTLRDVINRGGTGVISQAPYQVSITPVGSGWYDVSFTEVGAHYVALQGYTINYDQYLNETTTVYYNNPAWGTQQSTVFVDMASGAYPYLTHGGGLNVTLPSMTNAVIWPVADDGTGRTIGSVWDLQDGEVVNIVDEAYFIYVQ